MEINPIDLREIDKRAANVYEAIIVTAKKARQINDDNKIEFNALVSTIPSAGGEDDAEDIHNPVQLDISLEFEKRNKPHLEALAEFLEKGLEFRYK
jgi:ribosomal protein L14